MPSHCERTRRDLTLSTRRDSQRPSSIDKEQAGILAALTIKKPSLNTQLTLL